MINIKKFVQKICTIYHTLINRIKNLIIEKNINTVLYQQYFNKINNQILINQLKQLQNVNKLNYKSL